MAHVKAQAQEGQEEAGEGGAGTVDITVVVPVYNAMPYLMSLLRSLVDQDLPASRYEILAIDDGSTDEGPAQLDGFASRYCNVRVIHQENSGWPGIPRNRGLDEARGRYIFFADADDEMGPKALRRLVEFADLHRSDVVVPKMVGRGGRWVRDIYAQSQVDADLETVFTTLGPQKLFRRSFLIENGIRFPEEKVRLEDGMFLARAYLAARRVSILGGYDFYSIVARDDGQNISSQPFDPQGYSWSVGEVARIVRENDPDPERADRIILDLYRRKCLKFYEPARFLRMPSERRRAFLRAHAHLLQVQIPPELEARLEEPFRSRSRLARAQDEAGMLAAARRDLDEPLRTATLSRARWSLDRSLVLTMEVHGAQHHGLKPLELHVVRREDHVARNLPLARAWTVRAVDGSPTVSVVRVRIRPRRLRRLRGGVLDLSLGVVGTQERARIAAPLVSALPPARSGLRLYSTVQGNLSIDTAS